MRVAGRPDYLPRGGQKAVPANGAQLSRSALTIRKFGSAT